MPCQKRGCLRFARKHRDDRTRFEYLRNNMVNTPNRILLQMKSRGTQPAAALAIACSISPQSARLHLAELKGRGLVQDTDVNGGRGRPKRFWALTAEGHAHFPDRHSDLAVQLIQQAAAVLGDEAVSKLIVARENDIRIRDELEMTGLAGLEARLERMAELRSAEGYMAHLAQYGNGWLLTHDHCPIRKAVGACPDLCKSELALLRHAVGTAAKADRVEHVVKGDRRCSYLIQRRG
jgi:predicted ArsR family transcriptional regulator